MQKNILLCCRKQTAFHGAIEMKENQTIGGTDCNPMVCNNSAMVQL